MSYTAVEDVTVLYTCSCIGVGVIYSCRGCYCPMAVEDVNILYTFRCWYHI